MKQSVLIVMTAILLLMLNVISYAQDRSQGIVEYEVVYDSKAFFGAAQFNTIPNLPDSVRRIFIYQYNGDYAKVSEGSLKNNVKFVMDKKFDKPGTIYLSMKDNQIFNLAKINDQHYLIQDYGQHIDEGDLALEKTDNSINDETRTILGFTCKKGKRTTPSGVEIIWYTTEIPTFGGPLGLYKNGMILAMESEKFSVRAKTVEFKKVQLSEVQPPKNIKVISSEEYNEQLGKN